MTGIEPVTSSLPRKCSTAELHEHRFLESVCPSALGKKTDFSGADERVSKEAADRVRGGGTRRLAVLPLVSKGIWVDLAVDERAFSCLKFLLSWRVFLATTTSIKMEPTNPQIPDLSGAETASAIAGGIFGLIFFLVMIAIAVFVMLTLQKHYEAIAPEHREFDPPGKVWMLLIPFFNLYWVFIVYPGLGRSYQKALAAKGITEVGDAGEKLGLWLAISIVAGIIPLVNMVAGIASLVLLIMFFTKMADQKKRLVAAG